MKRYWVSWFSGYYEDEGCTKPPFQVWISGYRDRPKSDRDECIICAVIDANSEKQIWEAVKKHFPDFKERFCEQKDVDYKPSGRFQNFEGKTTI